MLLAERFEWRTGGTYVEVGALDGDLYSNTYLFEHQLGWSGVLVEANPEQAQVCRVSRPASQVVAQAAVAPGSPASVTMHVASEAGYSSLGANGTYERILRERDLRSTTLEVPASTLDEMLDGRVTTAIDFVTIDVEGHELAVLQGFDLRRWAPEVVLLERATPAPELRVVLLMFKSGYGPVRRVVINDWFERASVRRRLWLVAAAYVSAAPDVARYVGREVLRAVGLLDVARGVVRRLRSR